MTFGFIEAEKASFQISRMCPVLDVSQSGFFAWQERPAGHRQQQDMVYLALAIVLGPMADNGSFRTAFALSSGTYGSPRMRPPTSSMRAMRSGGIARHV
jgi:putative transposase